MSTTRQPCASCLGTNCTSPSDLPAGARCTNPEHACPSCNTEDGNPRSDT